MKRITAILLAAALLLTAAACDSPSATTPPADTTQPSQTTQATQPTTQEPTEPTAPLTVSVTLDANGGECDVTAIAVIQLESYGPLPVPSREGYVFLGWFTAAEAGEQVTQETVMTAGTDHTIFAQWTPKTEFTVTLDANGGRISPYYSQLLLKNGDTYGTLPEPLREGYKFLGWYTEPEKGTRVRSTTKFTQKQDLALYAHWEYDAQAYWRHVLDSTVQQIPYCRRVVVYLERNAGSKTYIDCPFLTESGAINPAEGLEHYKVTDDWIRSVQPYIIVKLTSSTSMAQVSYIGMQRRFPDAEIYVFSTSAVSGSEAYQLYCRLYLAKLLYPEYFEDVDLDTVKAELKVNPKVFHE